MSRKRARNRQPVNDPHQWLQDNTALLAEPWLPVLAQDSRTTTTSTSSTSPPTLRLFAKYLVNSLGGCDVLLTDHMRVWACRYTDEQLAELLQNEDISWEEEDAVFLRENFFSPATLPGPSATLPGNSAAAALTNATPRQTYSGGTGTLTLSQPEAKDALDSNESAVCRMALTSGHSPDELTLQLRSCKPDIPFQLSLPVQWVPWERSAVVLREHWIDPFMRVCCSLAGRNGGGSGVSSGVSSGGSGVVGVSWNVVGTVSSFAEAYRQATLPISSSLSVAPSSDSQALATTTATATATTSTTTHDQPQRPASSGSLGPGAQLTQSLDAEPGVNAVSSDALAKNPETYQPSPTLALSGGMVLEDEKQASIASADKSNGCADGTSSSGPVTPVMAVCPVLPDNTPEAIAQKNRQLRKERRKKRRRGRPRMRL